MSGERDEEKNSGTTAIADATTESQVAKEVVRIDRNFGAYPIFVSSQYKGKSREIAVTENHRDGSVSQRRLLIGRTSKGIEVGVLYPIHAKVFYVLLKQWQDRGKIVGGSVFYSLYAIAKKLGWQWNDSASQGIKKILLALREIPITWQNSFWKASDKSYSQMLANFSVLTHLVIREVKKGEKREGVVQFEINRLIIENLGKVYTFPLRLDVVLALKKDIAVLLYPYIERALAHRNIAERDISALWDSLGLSKHYIRKPSDYKTTITPALEELEGKHFFWGELAYARVESKKDGSGYKVVFQRQAPLPANTNVYEGTAGAPATSHSPEHRPLNRYEQKAVSEAVKRLGGDRSKFEVMVRRHGLSKFRSIILQT